MRSKKSGYGNTLFGREFLPARQHEFDLLLESTAIRARPTLECSFEFFSAGAYLCLCHRGYLRGNPSPILAHFIVGIENSAPSLTPEGQRAVTVLVLV